MKILFSGEWKRELVEEMHRTIVDEFQGAGVEFFPTVDGLANRINETKDARVAVIFADSEEYLLNLYFMKHHLYAIPVFLLLPDREPETRAVGFRIKPRALCFKDSTVEEIRQSFRRILALAGSNGVTLPPDGAHTRENSRGPDVSIWEDRAA